MECDELKMDLFTFGICIKIVVYAKQTDQILKWPNKTNNFKWIANEWDAMTLPKKTLHSCKIVHSAENKNDFLSVKSRWDKFIMELILSSTSSHDSFLECAIDVNHDSQQK